MRISLGVLGLAPLKYKMNFSLPVGWHAHCKMSISRDTVKDDGHIYSKTAEMIDFFFLFQLNSKLVKKNLIELIISGSE